MNELEPYFSEQFASDEVVERHSSLVSIFEKLERASSEWFHLTERPVDKQRISRDYANDVYRIELFENKHKEWLERVYTPVRRELYGKGTANISGVDLNLKTPVVPSVERRQELQNANIEASYVTNISEVLGARTSNVIQNTPIHDTAPDQTCVLAERERLQLRSQLMQAKIDAERAELEATFREQVGDGSVTSLAGSVRVRENVERYLTGLTSSVIPGQPFEDERQTGKYTLAEVKVDPHELKFLSGGATPHGVPTFHRGSRRPGKSGCHAEDVNPDNTAGKF